MSLSFLIPDLFVGCVPVILLMTGEGTARRF